MGACGDIDGSQNHFIIFVDVESTDKRAYTHTHNVVI